MGLLSKGSSEGAGRAIIDTTDVAEARCVAAERAAELIEQRDALADDPGSHAARERIDAELAGLIDQLQAG